MSKKNIKLIWDFRGGDALGTAQHHVVHLEEFSKATGISSFGIDVEEMSPMWVLAYMIVSEENMIEVRDRLRPHRAVYAE